MARIYICDDDKILAKMLCDFLVMMGHSPAHAVDVPALRALIDKGRPDLVILDIQMGGGGGPAALAAVSTLLVPVIFMSGMKIAEQRKWFPAASQNMMFFEKPMKLDDLHTGIMQLLNAQAAKKKS